MYKKEDYYTAGEAMRKLGLTKPTFHRQVNEGLIQKAVPPGKKQGVYSKRDVDALSASMNWIFARHQRIDFSKSSPGDQMEEMNIGIKCFGTEFITPLPERIAFQQKSEYTFWSLKVDNKVVGYLTMFRFPPQFLDDLLTGRRMEREITVKEVLPFARLEAFDICIDVMALDPSLAPHLKHLYAGIIVERFANTILQLLNNNFCIQNVYTVSATKEGDNLIRKVGFKLMEGKSLARGRIAYVFPLDEEGKTRLEFLTGRKTQH